MKKLLKPAMVVLAVIAAAALPSCAEEKVEPLFAPTLESMEEHFQMLQWYKDAKFGIFTHWGLQCQPESGDWYARNMYYRGHWHFNHHKEKYGAGPQSEDAGVVLRDQGFNEGQGKPATSEDLRFTTKNGKLYVFTLLIPKPGAPIIVTDLDAPVKNVRLFGSEKPVKWTCENNVLTITAPDADPNLKIALCYEVEFEQK